MTTCSPDDLERYDVSWFAVDREDGVGVFWTAGRGEPAFPTLQTQGALGHALDVMATLPPVTEAVVEHRSIGITLSGQLYDGIHERRLARAGLHVYDHLDARRPQIPPDPKLHVRLARPRRPLKVPDMRGDLAAYLALLRCQGVLFRELEVIDIRSLVRSG